LNGFIVKRNLTAGDGSAIVAFRASTRPTGTVTSQEGSRRGLASVAIEWLNTWDDDCEIDSGSMDLLICAD